MILFGGVGMGYLNCPDCFTSFQRAFIVSIFTASFWVFLWKGNEFIAEYLDCHTSWLEHPLRRLVVGLLAMLVYTVTITTLINYIFIIIILQREFSSEIIREQFIPTSVIAVVITLIIALFLHGRAFLLSWRQAAINAEKMKTESI